MNIRKFISASTCASMLACFCGGCSGRNTENEMEESTMENTGNTTAAVSGEITTEEIPTAVVDNTYYAVTVDGNTINMDAGTVYRGLGVITGNNSSRLLMDYKTENPEAYWEIMNLLFKPDYGAGLTHVKIEFGSDVNFSSGTEPSIMRSEDEEADVTRGAGFMFAADALSINPDITVDLLRWGEPQWVTNAFDESTEAGHAARYKWYKAAIDKAYDVYGIKFTHISADANEAAKADTDWIVYFANALENETDECYDYGAIKIVASDELGTWTVARAMLENEELRNAVDILGEHYNTWADSNAKTLNSEYGNYTFTLENMAKSDAPIYIWETRGPDEGQEYDANYFRNIGVYQPVETDGKYSYSIEVKPYSIVTITTLDKTADTSVYNCGYEDIPLDINYSDDFEYSDEFLSARGYAPLYTTDYDMHPQS